MNLCKVVPKILVISSCTGEKAYKLKNSLTIDDFQSIKRLKSREKELEDYLLPAKEMYTGKQHLHVMDGLKIIRNAIGKEVIDFKIVSAGYGLIDENQVIAPYDITFSNMKSHEIIDWSNKLGIKAALEIILGSYDLAFFLLGDKYLKALNMPFTINKNSIITMVYFVGWSNTELIPDLDNYHIIGIDSSDSVQFGSALVSLKGLMFKRFCEETAQNVSTLNIVLDDPKQLYGILSRYKKNHLEKQLSLIPLKTKVSIEEEVFLLEERSKRAKRKFGGYIITENIEAANYRAGKKIKYYIPEWDDRVDPNYDFINDEHRRNNKTPYLNDLYSHEIYPEPNYDGILVSLTVLDNGKKEAMLKKGVHGYLRFPNKYPVMADCGAFNYISMELPPFETSEVITYYDQLGFNYGVSIDHLIVGDFERDKVVRQKRYDLTQSNAKDFIDQYRLGDYKFIPIGVAQGWDPWSYLDSVKNLIEFGYEYIALGSLIPKTSEQIYQILKVLAPLLPEYMELHLFGIARPEALDAYFKLGVTSFDSAGPLRQAWLSANANYYTMERKSIGNSNSLNSFKKYAAVRVPYVNIKGLNGRLSKDLLEYERAALDSLRKYANGRSALEETIKKVIEYEKMNNEAKLFRMQAKLNLLEENESKEDIAEELRKKKATSEGAIRLNEYLYRDVLLNKPWENCDCPICKDLGIEVIIFRGNNRNRRRGFHNTYIFNKQFRLALK
jgi:hypothetical protein